MSEEKPFDVKEWEYELEDWIAVLGSVPKTIVRSKDCSEPWEMDKRHLFKLENGKYAVVVERGCSCYEPSRANIELFPNESDAIKAFEKHDEAYEDPNKWKQ